MTVKRELIQGAQDSLKTLTNEIQGHLIRESETMTIAQGGTGLDPQQLQATMEVVQQSYKLWYTLEAFKRVV